MSNRDIRAALEQRADRTAQAWRTDPKAKDLGELLADFAEMGGLVITEDQARTILIALVHDGMDVRKLTETAKRQIREAFTAVLIATRVSDHG